MFNSNILDVDKLLGDPIQKKIESESGLRTSLESILTICAGLYENTVRAFELIFILLSHSLKSFTYATRTQEISKSRIVYSYYRML